MKRLIMILALAVAVILPPPSFAQTTTTQTSLSAAVPSGFTTNITVVSTNGISASTQTNTYYVYVIGQSGGQQGGELMKVTSVNTTTGSLGVVRAVNQTRATAHPSGAIVFFGPAGSTPFVTQDPFPGASCTATSFQFLPMVNTMNGNVIHCRNSVFTTGTAGVTGITGATTATLGDYLIEATSLASAYTVTLPTPVAGMRGKVFIVKNGSSIATNTLWIAGTIDGGSASIGVFGNTGAVVATTGVFNAAGVVRFISDGTKWLTW